LKMHEYLASGKPVASAPIRSVEEFRDVIAIANTREEWSRAIDNALSPQENTPGRCARRQEVARQQDWDVLVDRIAGTIARRLGIEAESIEIRGSGAPATSFLAAASEGMKSQC